MLPISRRAPYPPAGFTLVEIMIGMVIGMLGIIVIMQVFAIFEGQKRTTTGGADAQTAGAIALYGLQREIQQGGYGTNAFNIIGCDVLLRSSITLPAMAPVTIFPASMATPLIPAGDANSDTLLVVYGNTNGTPEGDGITAQVAADKTYTVKTPTGFAAGDLVIAAPSTRPSPCSGITNQLIIDKVVSVDSTTNKVKVTTADARDMVNGTLYNLGQSPKVQAYAVRNGNLTVCDYIANNCSDSGKKDDSTIWIPIANNIVAMRAQYGRDTGVSMDAIVDIYDQTTPTTQCGWARLSAVKIALVSRSANYEKDVVTTNDLVADPKAALAPVFKDSSGTNLIDLTGNANWKHYRYKLFQSVTPIRNIAWMGVQSGC